MSTTQTLEIPTSWPAVLSAAGAGLTAAGTFLWKPLIQPVIRRVVTRLRRKLTVQECYVKDAAIIQLLAELRATTSADRIALCQFQNGEHFSSSMVGWKSTVTHEVHALGIEPTLGAHQQILASRLYDVLKLLFDNIRSLREDRNASDINRNVVICKMTDDLAAGFARYSFEVRGVKKFSLAPIYKEVHGDDHLCGYIRLEYCGVNAHRCEDTKSCEECSLRKDILRTARMLEMEIYARARRR